MSKTNPYDKLKTEKSISIIVKPNTKKTILKSFDEERKTYSLDVAAPPENNKANKEITKYLQKITGKKPRIKSGLTSKKKLIVF